MTTKTLMIVSSLEYGEQLCQLMNSASIDFELVGIEYNGALGLAQFKASKPQIVILDASIAIIGVDRYINLMQSYATNFAIILLSDINDAGLDNIHYIYKTIRKSNLDHQEFTDTFQSAAASLFMRESPDPHQQGPAYEDAISILVGNGDFSAKHLYTLRVNYAWKLTPTVNILLPRPSDSRYQTSYSSLTEIRKLLASYHGGEALVMKDGVTCIVINEIPSTQDLNAEDRYEHLFNQIRRALGKEKGVSFTFFISNMVKLNELTRKYAELRQFYEVGYFLKDINLVLPNSLGVYSPADRPETFDSTIFNLSKALFAPSYDNFSTELKKLYLTVLKPGMNRDAVTGFSHKLYLLSHSMQLILPNSVTEIPFVFTAVYQTIEEELEALHSHFSLLFDHLHGRSILINSLTLQTISLVINNFHESISLKWMAERIHVSPSYLSHIFKKDMGIPLTHYINHTRIAIARLLICNEPIKMYQVSEATGFSDYRYFSQVFRFIMGMTPTEYQLRVSSNATKRAE